MDYYKLLLSNINKNKYKNCIIVNNKKHTYYDILNDSDSLASKIQISLQNFKIRSVVAVLSNNVYFQFIAFFALNKLKMIPLILHPNMNENQRELLLKKNKILYLLTEDEIKMILDKNATDLSFSNEELPKYTNAALTSGSTDIPKVLYRTYESWTGFFSVQNKVFSIDKNTVIFIHGPLSFTGNLNSILSVIYEGGTIVTYEGFNPRMWLKSINKYMVNTLYLVPAKLMALNMILQNSTCNIKSIFTGSGQLFGDIKEKLKEKYPSAKIILYYGASELNYISYISLDNLIKRPLSVGKPFENVKVKIIDNHIYVKSDFFVNEMNDWQTVNDLGYIKDGEIIFKGRGNDVLNKGGNTISLAKISCELSKIQCINESFAIKYKNKLGDDDIAAFVTTSEYKNKFEIRRLLRKNLMSYEMPRKIFILDKLPLNDSGKIDGKKLLENFKV